MFALCSDVEPKEGVCALFLGNRVSPGHWMLDSVAFSHPASDVRRTACASNQGSLCHEKNEAANLVAANFSSHSASTWHCATTQCKCCSTW